MIISKLFFKIILNPEFIIILNNMNYKYLFEKVPFIDISGSYSDSSKNNIFNNSRNLCNNYNLSYPRFKSLKEKGQYSSFSLKYNQKSFSNKLNSLDNLLSFSLKTKINDKKIRIFTDISLSEDKTKINQKIFHNEKIKKKEHYLSYDNKINNINKKRELYTPYKNISNVKCNKINKYKNKVRKYNVNYEGKNLMDCFEKIDLSPNKKIFNKLFSPNQKNNKNYNKFKNIFNSKEKIISIIKSEKFKKNFSLIVNKKDTNKINDQKKKYNYDSLIKNRLKNNIIYDNYYGKNNERLLKINILKHDKKILKEDNIKDIKINKINIEPIKRIKFWESEYKAFSYNKIKYKSVINIFNHSAQNNHINNQC